MITIKLKKPLIKANGERFTQLDLDFDSLTGADLLSIENEMRASGKSLIMANLTPAYFARVAAKAAGVRFELFNELNARDFTRVTQEAQAFLMVSDSEEEALSPTSEEQPKALSSKS